MCALIHVGRWDRKADFGIEADTKMKSFIFVTSIFPALFRDASCSTCNCS